MSHELLLSKVCTLLWNYPASWECVVHLWKHGFRMLGCGANKAAQWHPDFPEWAVKVFRRPDNWKKDCSAQGFIAAPLLPFWLPYVRVGKRFCIQPRADGVGGSPEEALEIIRKAIGPRKTIDCPWDTHKDNCAFHQGHPILFDYSLNWVTLPPTTDVSLDMKVI